MWEEKDAVRAVAKRVAIQGERGSNSHLAALAMLGEDVQIVPTPLSAEVIARVVSGEVDGAVLPIENSLHGSVAEHYDLLLEHPLRIDRESRLRIVHNLIAAPGVALADVKHVLSHPVALSQCRRFLARFTQAQALPFYDTAGSVRHAVEGALKDTAGIAPVLAAEVYGGVVLEAGVEDSAENYTRFHLLRRAEDAFDREAGRAPDKMSLAFAVDHHPGTLVAALGELAGAEADLTNLTKIESRPVPGRPWEYIFYVDLSFGSEEVADRALAALATRCRWVKELGRYAAARD